MPEFRARYFDGERAVAHDVSVSLDGLGLTIARADGRIDRWGRDEIAAKAGTENEPAFRVMSARAPGAQLVVEDARAIGALTSTLPSLRGRVRQPRRAGYWIGLTTGALAVVAAIVFAVDRLPIWAAPLVPAEWEAWLGKRVIDGLAQNGGFCRSATGQAALDDLARRLSMAADLRTPVTVRVVNWRIVNAFAVPGGQIGVLRGLIDRAESGDEVAGVLAHEIGHVVHRHPTVGVLRQMGLAATLQLLLGGSGTGVEDAASLGNMLLTLSYSREAEAAADATALEILGRAGLDAHGLNRFFARLRKEGDIEESTPSLLLTHPPTAERLAATAQAPNGAPALTPAQWQALRAICE
jgi:Zn-dependent protease with chaperone function